MILFFNVKITNQGLSYYARADHLPGADRLNIFKYCLASYSALVPVLSKCIFYIQLESMFADRQDELDQCLDLFDQHPAPELKLQIFTNLNAKLSRVQHLVERVKILVDQNKLREFEITASLDCWGAPQEYVRYPLDLSVWQQNFEYLVHQSWINLIINSTVTPLTVKTLPALLQKINVWSTTRKIYHYQNAVNSPSYMFIDIFGDIFQDDFADALAIKPNVTLEEQASWRYLQGIAQQSAHRVPNVPEIKKLFSFLNENDRRRHTNWPTVFPWLVDEFARHDLKI
jgi:hypothetical protein